MLSYHDITKHMVQLFCPTANKSQNLNKDDNVALPFSFSEGKHNTTLHNEYKRQVLAPFYIKVNVIILYDCYCQSFAKVL